MIAAPLLAGAVKLTLALPLPPVAVTAVGAFGAPTGVTLLEGADAGPVPALFSAVTVNEYAVPFVSPVTVIGLVEPFPVIPPGFDVAV